MASSTTAWACIIALCLLATSLVSGQESGQGNNKNKNNNNNEDFGDYNVTWTPTPSDGSIEMEIFDNNSTVQSVYGLHSTLGNIVAVHMVHIPGTDKYLFMERPSGFHPDRSRVIAGTYDLSTSEFTNLDSPDGLFCAGHTLLSNGSVVIVGGHVENAGYPSGIQSIRTFTDGTPGLVKVNEMRWRRWYPTATLLPDKRIMIMGGTQGVGAGTDGNNYYEIWDPSKPKDLTKQLPMNPVFMNAVKQNYYPFNFVLPTGHLFSYCGRIGYIMDPYTGNYMRLAPPRPPSKVNPSAIYTTQFPYTGSAVMLPLRPEADYDVEVLIVGGADVATAQSLEQVACSESIRLRISMPKPWAKTADAYNFWANTPGGGWVQEQMALPRVMPDTVVLPNGVVVVLNGAQRGLAGDSASGGGSRATFPNFYAEMYDPYADEGTRWTTLARSKIARLYHSTASLTTDGTIFVCGCDRCGKIETDDQLYVAPPCKAEYRCETFYPPFFYDSENKVVIMDFPSTIHYGQDFYVSFAGELDPNAQADSAVLVAPSAVTHSFNQNQRVVKLVVKSMSDGSMMLTAPPSANHAPPQMYMLFLLKGQTYSKAQWVMLDV